jgi:hypothetical protein
MKQYVVRGRRGRISGKDEVALARRVLIPMFLAIRVSSLIPTDNVLTT